MKFGTILRDGKAVVVAASSEEKVVVLRDIMAHAPVRMEELLDADPARLAHIRQVLLGQDGLPMEAVHWLPPVCRPGKVICVALNNSANKARIIRGPDHPAMFIKPASALIGHGQAIRLRPEYGRVHPEPELVAVIGKAGSSITPGQALGHVFGYTLINDLTSPTMRTDDTFHYRAIYPKDNDAAAIEYVDTWVSYPARYKCADTFGPVGPWIATRDAIADPHDLTIRCVHRGELITEDNTGNLFYKVHDVVSYASHFMTLEAGDMIAMGTALKAADSQATSGGRAVQNVDLNKLGGPIEISIAGIGRLVNTVEWTER